MFEHYLPNKNERATVAPKSKFLQLNTASVSTPSVLEFPVVLRSVVVFKFDVVLVSRDVHLT